MNEVKKKSTATGMEDENSPDILFNLQRLKDGYASVVDKMGYPKFKPYLHRLFHSVETMVVHEVTEFKKIDAKYQDIVRQCHMYEKTLSLLKENNCVELSSFNESSNTYALDDLTKVTPYLAPDLLQSTLGAGNGGGSTSIQFRLPRQLSSLSNRQYVSTPLGPSRTNKPAVPLAHFDDDSSFVLTRSLGFPQQEKQFVDASTDPEPVPVVEQKDFSCQITPSCTDQEVETVHLPVEYQSTQTDVPSTEAVACQITPEFNHCSIQTISNEQTDFSCQFMPTSIDQTTETIILDYHTQLIQTDLISTNDYSCQMTPEYVHQQTETITITTEDIALQSSFDQSTTFDDQEIQTDFLIHIDISTQYELDTVILPILFSEELPVSNEVEIPIEKNLLLDQGCQTMNDSLIQADHHTQTPHIHFIDCASQSSVLTYESRDVQTEPCLNLYSSSLFIVPTSVNQSNCSSKIVIMPKDDQFFSSSSTLVIDQEVQCDLLVVEPEIPIVIEQETKTKDRRSIIQQQMDQKEKQMNRIIEEYAALYGEFEMERHRNVDLREARDRLADHIKILSDELGDREIRQEKLLIKSDQQNKLINYMLPQIDCSPTPKKKQQSASSFRRLLPRFK